MKTTQILTALLLSSIRAAALEFDFVFVPQQQNAPEGQFNLQIVDHFNSSGEQRWSSVTIQNVGVAQLVATELYVFESVEFGRIIDAQISSTLETATFHPGPDSATFSAHHPPLEVPASIVGAIEPRFSYALIDGPGIVPGYFFEWYLDPAHVSLIDYFNSGELKLGLKTADGEFTYVAAAVVPESGSLLLVLGGIFVLMLSFKTRLSCS